MGIEVGGFFGPHGVGSFFGPHGMGGFFSPHGMSGFLGLILLILNIWAIVKVAQSGARTGDKVLWIILILLLPMFGLILWFLLGPRG